MAKPWTVKGNHIKEVDMIERIVLWINDTFNCTVSDLADLTIVIFGFGVLIYLVIRLIRKDLKK